MAEQSVPPEAIEAAILAAARAYCADRFDYSGPYATPTGAQEHLERDAKSMALERPLRLWIEAAAPVLVAAGRAQAAADLRFAAEGRAEYARTASPEHRELLAFEAGTLDHAAAVAGGDIQPLYGWVPSRMWTPEMNAKLAEEAP